MNNSETSHVVMIGAGYAGLMAALHLANQTRRQPIRITLINASDRFVERIRLHQLAAGQTLRDRPLIKMIAGTGITFVQGTVTALQPAEKTISVQTQAGAQIIYYDKLVYALGSQTDHSRIPGADQHAYTFEYRSTVALKQKLATVAANSRVLVIGGGLTGIEAATEIAEQCPQVQVILATSGTFGSDLSEAGVRYLRHVFAELRIAVRDNTTIQELKADQALTTAGKNLSFDICVSTVGFSVPDLARRAGFAVNAVGQVIVDAFLRSVSHPDVYAIGDGAALTDSADLSLRMACATAIPMGIHAADSLGATLHGKQPQPFAFGYVLRCISLGRQRGLVQVVDSTDQPRPRVFTGWTGAVVKELICRYVVFSLQMERRQVGFYQWSHARKAHSIDYIPHLMTNEG